MVEIVRANPGDTNMFTEVQLTFGACCFYTGNKKYFFEINGKEATLFTNTNEYINLAIDEFLFYSGFITKIKDQKGRILTERNPNAPILYEVAKIQPSQFYISEEKLQRCKKWITKPDDILIPISIIDSKVVALDGHTRLRAALDFGFEFVYAYTEDSGEYVCKFADKAISLGIKSVTDMELLGEEEYKVKWHGFCDDFFGR